jgi:hypothetical protein
VIPADYFDRLDTLSKSSPVGKLKRKIQARFRNLDLEMIREESRAFPRDIFSGVQRQRPVVACAPRGFQFLHRLAPGAPPPQPES